MNCHMFGSSIHGFPNFTTALMGIVNWPVGDGRIRCERIFIWLCVLRERGQVWYGTDP